MTQVSDTSTTSTRQRHASDRSVRDDAMRRSEANGMVYTAPGRAGSVVDLKTRYDNFVGGHWVPPVTGQYHENLSPVTGRPFCEVARSSGADIELALDAAHAAREAWADTSLSARAQVLNAIADVIDANREVLAVAESWDNGKPVRETLAADLPLAADHFRYFASATRTLEGTSSEIDKDTVAYHFHEPLGVVGQIIPFNFPLLMAAWKMAPALAAGNCTVVKPASPTPWSILKLAELIQDIVPPGVVNVVNGPGAEIGKALATSPRIAKIAFTGETATGRLIMQYASKHIIPVTLELGGKSPNIFFGDVMAEDDDYLDKAIEGLVLYAFNKGEVCTCPSRALVDERIYDAFMDRVLARVGAIRQGNPLDTTTMIGAQVSAAQMEKIDSYVEIGRREGAEVLIGGQPREMAGELKGGYYYEPTVLWGHNDMRVFQEEIFGPVLAVTTFRDEADALRIANDTQYGLGAGVWTRDGNRAYRLGRAIKAGRVWTNCYHLYPAGAAFGGYKISGVGRETHKMALEHYSQTKNLLVSYSTTPLGFF
ncbi:MAG TPA: aldehyde dehydrogenase family protein [Acidimicrobiales bacterium]|nr:aldehyde dehydrogenase family protein [Acidimicrobiales bacterium]